MMKNTLYDCCIIGGGPAGSTAATTLTKLGHSVLLLEKAKFPREHVGESLLPFCYQIFEELGVLDQMEANFSRKPGVTFSNIDGSSYSNWCFTHVIQGPSALSFHVRRAQFDEILLKNSEENGATVWQQTKVLNVDFEREKNVSIVVAEDRKGNTIHVTAKFVIDASGQDTLLAKQLKCQRPFERLNMRVAYSTHWIGIKYDEDLKNGNIKIVHLEGEKIGWLWMIPLSDNRLSIGVAVNMEYAKAERRRLSKKSDDWLRDFYLQELRSSTVVTDIIAEATMDQPIAANGDFSYYTTEKYNNRYAIIGDASAFLDPIFSSGIYLGMKGGQLVANGVSQLLTNADMSVLKNAYHEIEGAYRLVEKLINIFYQPDSIHFSEADMVSNNSYEKFESAYSILHLILAGDFFSNHEKYIKAIDLLKDKSKIEKYIQLVKHPKENRVCEGVEELNRSAAS